MIETQFNFDSDSDCYTDIEFCNICYEDHDASTVMACLSCKQRLCSGCYDKTKKCPFCRERYGERYLSEISDRINKLIADMHMTKSRRELRELKLKYTRLKRINYLVQATWCRKVDSIARKYLAHQ